MNRTYDKDFFQAWDRAREIASSLGYIAQNKRELELEEELNHIMELNGFSPDLDYQDCIRGYREIFYV